MNPSLEEATGVLGKWCDEPTEIQVLFTGAGEKEGKPPEKAFACFWGFVKSVSRDHISVTSRTDPFFSISVDLAGAHFKYSEPREASTLKEQVALTSKYICSLTIDLPTGGRCFLAELRE
jgi:hypothetical protein